MPAAITPIVPEQLGKTELFARLPAEALAAVAAAGQTRRLLKDTRLFAQGVAAERCHAVLAGRVRISQSGADGGQLLVRFVGPGEMFGTVALFTDRRYPAEAVAVVDSLEMSWTEPRLIELIHRYPLIAVNLVRTLGARLREVQERLREVATQRADQRIAGALLRLAGRNATASEAIVIDFPLTRQDIADMCGTTLYTASRVLTGWQKAGYVATHRRRLCIRDPGALRRLVGSLA